MNEGFKSQSFLSVSRGVTVWRSFASPLVTRILSGYFAVLNSYLQMNRTSRRICMQRLLFSVSTCNE